MYIEQLEGIQGNTIELSEISLVKEGNQLKLMWKFCCNNKNITMTFYNVSRLRMNNISAPLQVQGFEIVEHSREGWDNDSKYEIRDFEDDSVNFFCEYFNIN